ncbi:hypothetical protein bcgnr5372_41030 [Bacillus luti]|nr:WGR domain-containing protein [Bacillus cereus]
MSKTVFNQHLVLLDFEENKFRFFHVELIRLGRDKYHLVTTQGKLGNQGKKTLNTYVGYDEALSECRAKVYMKKKEGYSLLVEVKGAIEKLHKQKNKPRKYNKPKSVCDICSKEIEKEKYKMIDEWARGEGGWDKNPNGVAYKKILCIDCQIDHKLYKKRLNN